MNWWLLLLAGFAVIGLLFLVKIMPTMVHEQGHIWNLQRTGFEPKEYCYLGKKELTSNNITITAYGWVVPPKDSNESIEFDIWWDSIWHKNAGINYTQWYA